MNIEWSVRYNREGEPGKPISLQKNLIWGGNAVHIPAAYICKEGLVLDIFLEVDREAEKKFLDKWVPIAVQRQGNFSRTERRQLRQENPAERRFNCDFYINGELRRDGHSSVSVWIPEDLRPDEQDFHDGIESTLQHYGFDLKKVWIFRRCYRDWRGEKTELSSLEVTLRAEDEGYGGEPFSMPPEGESTEIKNPVTGETHTLTVEQIHSFRTPIPEQFAEYEMPDCSVSMIYRLEPDIPRDKISVKDTRDNEQARRKDGSPYNGGCFGIMHRMPEQGLHLAMSSMRFAFPETILWEPEFRVKSVEDLHIILL